MNNFIVNSNMNNFRNIPSIDSLLNSSELKETIPEYGRDLVLYAARIVVGELRDTLRAGKNVPSPGSIITRIIDRVRTIASPSLKPVVNATGVILHTNIGRAPLGKAVLEDIAPIVAGYSNVEFDLYKGRRGNRNDHLSGLFSYLTGAEDAIVVNNNAAGLILVLSTFAKNKEVIISRGELIEIGGSFRIPEIMAAGGAKMIEVGTTNRTRLSDYEQALSPETALIFKAHRSNYAVTGFTEEASLTGLASFAHSKGVPFVYDIGSGLLRKPSCGPVEKEPDVSDALAAGVDLVCFSCDKLLGGPQGGVIAGKSELVSVLKKAPLMRALRVGKLTIAALTSACRNYLSDERLLARNPAFTMFTMSKEAIETRAEKFVLALETKGVSSEIIPSTGQAGGGSLPDATFDSAAVALFPQGKTSREKEKFSEHIFDSLLRLDHPVLGVLREGRVILDMLTVGDDEIEYIAGALTSVVQEAGRLLACQNI
ncbi:MAG: L-seryl-tRNA(Sec) selenium transferase [Chitinivibrionales bacterium]|nr:L-seryl-tRNA(Sec) selenium transferase [Chitinivibrionales bacterium]